MPGQPSVVFSLYQASHTGGSWSLNCNENKALSIAWSILATEAKVNQVESKSLHRAAPWRPICKFDETVLGALAP